MKLFRPNKNRGLTLIEVLVIIVVLVIFFSMIDFAASPNAKRKAQRINCVNNLKQIGLAYRLWDGDQGSYYQMQVSVTNGGVMEVAQKGIAYISYQVMSNELTNPKILICPADTNRFIATNFSKNFGNSNVSYFVGLDAFDNIPGLPRLLSGDDNLAIDNVPIKSGLLTFLTNAPVSWTATRHHFAGNIGFADCSVQQVTQEGLRHYISETGLATNRLAIP